MSLNPTPRLAAALLILRIPLALFILQWGVEKFVIPESATGIGRAFYGVDFSGWVVSVQGGLQIALALALLLGVSRTVTYGAAFLMHSVTTIVTLDRLLHPYTRGNHLFLTGVPVLAAFAVLFLLRAEDRWSVDGLRSR